MLRTQIAAVIGCARGNALDEIMREVWTRYGAGQLTDDEAGELTRGRNKICSPRHAKPERSMNVMRREGGALAA